MASIFKGLAMSGAWACFDEFNRIARGIVPVIAADAVIVAKMQTPLYGPN